MWADRGNHTLASPASDLVAHLRPALLPQPTTRGMAVSSPPSASLAQQPPQLAHLHVLLLRTAQIHEEEWSYIPVGGPLPLADPTVTAFGAAANLVHPATGFSVSRSFREAPLVAAEIEAALGAGLSVADASKRVWDKLWPMEKRTQASFHVFGMELLATLDLSATNAFFNTFFRLPAFFWRGFLASTLSAGQLIGFALVVFTLAPVSIKYKLIEHLVTVWYLNNLVLARRELERSAPPTGVG
ncbi:Lycopene epsilon cyclase, chloroplastic [Tetrabaena socialis]|uniref:Lycopene epsilon cyclase, chloroplastic n=1 Tax=Tetrabaena socialis TaxID=47790 RepID=A0A2J8A0S9_9CHLO|nr:Lycopene epsilon cyclase, chloroplastic [Tetrabaena socialis]|eukprot:PNH06127.1 Lycopene epsilon cyclase, chloroplastic [Tetrabaena socialis]